MTAARNQIAQRPLADAPADITATELFDVLTEALERCGCLTRVFQGQQLGILATCISVMRARGWTVRPPSVLHVPIEPR